MTQLGKPRIRPHTVQTSAEARADLAPPEKGGSGAADCTEHVSWMWSWQESARTGVAPSAGTLLASSEGRLALWEERKNHELGPGRRAELVYMLQSINVMIVVDKTLEKPASVLRWKLQLPSDHCSSAMSAMDSIWISDQCDHRRS